jgi:DnaJ like chaperone protein
MNFIGKLIGAVIGFLVFHGNPIAVIVCIAFGHIWDRSVGSMQSRAETAPLSFVEPLFGLAGAIAKSDGRVSEREIAATENLMQRMQLDSALRTAAINQFNAGKQAEFSTTTAIFNLKIWSAGRRDRAFLLVDLLLDIVCADGPLAPAKLALVRKLCWALGMDERQLAAVAAMKGYAYVAPENWQEYNNAQDRDRARAAPRSAAPGKDPYAVLGIERTASDAEVKRAYRKLMSQHHPDKLGNVPDELKRRAEERAREINAAYVKVQGERGFK